MGGRRSRHSLESLGSRDSGSGADKGGVCGGGASGDGAEEGSVNNGGARRGGGSLTSVGQQDKVEEFTGRAVKLCVTAKLDGNGELGDRVVKEVRVKSCYKGNESGCLGCCACLR